MPTKQKKPPPPPPVHRTFWQAVESYFRDAINFHEPSQRHAEINRAIARWGFELLRNLVLVGLLQYAAEKSGSRVLSAISMASWILLLYFLFSYFDTWTVRPFPYIKNRKVWFVVNFTLGITVAFALFMGSQYLIMEAINELARTGH